jgi:hypothetical protein
MKAKLAIIVLGASVLMATGANAQHRSDSHGYGREETPGQNMINDENVLASRRSTADGSQLACSQSAGWPLARLER